MTSITPTDTAAARTAATQKSLTPDLNMFLKLLTTQLQHQDPLSPMDTAQYTQQLVQYSQVEQSLQQTLTLKEILSGLTTQGMAQASALVGHQVEVASDIAGLSSDTPANWSFDIGQRPAALTGTILDSHGRTVDTITLNPSATGTIRWDGRTAAGVAPDGLYTLSLKATTVSGDELPVTVKTAGIIKDVVQNDGAVLVGINGLHVPVAKLTTIN
ncbi:flagellar hook assembly protein FlgD [Sphingomonas endophytica]|uniref:Basal-body rod modification protein FlgD n=1 Tax=Sphingomonas endophytica TaxID=869719 RepID=A0ABR6N4D2_9SPHN|nr:flagellar hook capping FlgD N-terminal domain-containing protein [Sphingomonas endophytica]MBB5725644.1 flagellar basal-body rod modification protein FlgD [Sphingomonas endophytica]